MNKEPKKCMAKFIPEEVLVEILKRVPPKSLMRFTCVCKLWHSIIISSRFIDLHLAFTLKAGTNRLYFVTKGSSVPRYSLCNDDASLTEISLLTHPLSNYEKKEWEILGTINGLVCLYCVSADLNGTKYAEYVLWNPAVQKVRPIARSMVTGTFWFRSLVCGFGYDSINDDYKMIRFEYFSNNPSAYLFSLRRGSWRALDPEPLRVNRYKWVNCKGNVHWLNSGILAVFDMVAEEFKEFMLPNGVVHSHDNYLILGVCGDFLSVICRKRLQNNKMDLWVMKEYGVQESWIKQFSVDILGDVEKFAGFTHSGELLMVANRRLISYNMETKDSTVSEHEGLSFCTVLPYIGSLILADIGSACPLRFGTQDQHEENELNNVVI